MKKTIINTTVRAWFVWILSCFFYFYEFLLQVSPSVMGSHLMREFSVTADGLGVLSGVYFLSYAGMQVPAGILLDRLGPHRLLTLACVICALSSLVFGTTEHFYAAVFARFLIGFGSAFAFVGALKLVANWFPANRFALLTGLIVMIGMLGAIGGEAPLAHLIAMIGWRNSMFALGIVGLILSLIIFLVIKDTPTGREVPKKTSYRIVGKEFIGILKNKQLWLVAAYGGLMYMPTPTLCGLWGVPFLTSAYSVSDTVAAGMISLILFGWVAGSPLWGAASDYAKRRLPTLYLAAILAPLSLLLIIYYHFSSLIVLQLFLFAFGFFSCAFLPSFSIAREINKPEQCATALSFMNMMNMVGVTLAQPLLGRVLDASWDGVMHNGIRIYSLANYKFSITIMLAVMVIALILLPFIKDTYAKPRHS